MLIRLIDNHYKNIIIIILMETTILQVPILKTLKQSAYLVAKEYGFSSLQDLVRLFLAKLAKKQIAVTIEERAVPLSAKSEKRYLAMDEDFDKGRKTKSFTSVSDLMRDLRS